jgi:class 3 adenylate cyclase
MVVLSELTAEDLKDLGVNLVGHRRRLLTAIASLRGGREPEPVAESRNVIGASTGERRQLTVMFCDLVGSTALAARLDPEDLRDVVTEYHRSVAEIITRFEGFVARYMGDGVMAYFGYPIAHEDDAERAVRASLAVIGEIRRLPMSEPLQVRIGLASGLAVVGDLIGSGAAQEQAVIGETPNLAARLQALAEPDTIVIGENTRRLIGNRFEYQSLGEVEIKGLEAPVPAYRILGESRVGSRFEALRSGESPLIGRSRLSGPITSGPGTRLFIPVTARGTLLPGRAQSASGECSTRPSISPTISMRPPSGSCHAWREQPRPVRPAPRSTLPCRTCFWRREHSGWVRR